MTISDASPDPGAWTRAWVWFGLACLAAAACVFAAFGSISHFVITIDHCAELGCDVKYYLGGAEQLWRERTYAPGYLYSPTFALLTAPWLALDAGTATTLWIAGIGLCVLVYAALLALLVRARGRPWMLPLVPFAVFTSFPVLHDFKWGQVSLPVMLLCVASALGANRRPTASALALVLATLPKYYPGLLALAHLRRAEWPWVARYGGALVIALAVVPLLCFGPHGAVDVYLQAIAAAQERMGSATADMNSQFFPAVRARLGWPAHIDGLRFVWLAANAFVALRHRDTDPLFSALLLLCCTPLVLSTSWPHYFAYLPAAQAWVLVSIDERSSPRRALVVAGLLVSALTSSLGWFALHANWQQYAGLGWPLWSSLAINIGLWLSWPAARDSQPDHLDVK